LNRNTIVSCIVLAFVLTFLSGTVLAQSSLIWDSSAENNGATMESTYTELYFGDTVDQSFEVRVANAPPNQLLKVFIRQTAIGVIATDANGFGRLTKGRLGVPLDGDGRPDSPRIETGDKIRIVDVRQGVAILVGTFIPR